MKTQTVNAEKPFQRFIERRNNPVWQEEQRKKRAARVEKYFASENGGNFLSIEKIKTGIESLVQQDTSDKPKFLSSVIDLSIDMPEPVPVLKQGEYVIFSRGNISTIGGKAKSRKTFLIVLLAADFLENGTGKVLIVDTEMAKAHTYKTARRIHQLRKWDTRQNNERLTVLSLREYTSEERSVILKEAMEHLRPELIFIDGVRDLVKDFNNIDESNKIINMLMKLSTDFDCHICNILHENKINVQLRGHLGTEIINKSETVLSVTTNGEITTVKPEYTRNISFEGFALRVNDDGLPEYCDVPVDSTKDDKCKQLFELILPNGIALSYTDLRGKVAVIERIAEATAGRRIATAVKMKIIIKKKDGKYYLNTITS